jgi:drug/metabolite transporter (DMT)-like permease
MLFLYRGMSHGAVSVVVTVSAVGGVALPVLAAVAFLGDRPSPLSWSGIAVAVPALCLVARSGKDSGASAAAVTDGLLAGVGIAVQYLALAQAPARAALWPVAAGRLAACLALLPLVIPTRVPALLPPRLSLAAAANGALTAVALTLYLLATRQQLLAIAVVLSSLYPAVPVLLGLTVLRERLNRSQLAGMIAAAAAVALLTAG